MNVYARPWTTEYENNVGPNDDYFIEWWAVKDANGQMLARAETEEIAQWIAAMGNVFVWSPHPDQTSPMTVGPEEGSGRGSA